MSWAYDDLWRKARLYVQRALVLQPDDEARMIWLILGLEFLIRSTLAKHTPVLLAECKDNQSDNLLYALGLPHGSPTIDKESSSYKSIVTSVAIQRLRLIHPEFGSFERKCLLLINLRNEELHSGGHPFIAYYSERLLADYYLVAKVLLQCQGKELVDLFVEEASRAETLIAVANTDVMERVLAAIKAARDKFFALTPAVQTATKQMSSNTLGSASRFYDKHSACPSCGAMGRIHGEGVGEQIDIRNIDEVIRIFSILPNGFACYCCGLKINEQFILLDSKEMQALIARNRLNTIADLIPALGNISSSYSKRTKESLEDYYSEYSATSEEEDYFEGFRDD